MSLGIHIFQKHTIIIFPRILLSNTAQSYVQKLFYEISQ